MKPRAYPDFHRPVMHYHRHSRHYDIHVMNTSASDPVETLILFATVGMVAILYSGCIQRLLISHARER
ncbi:hypothetical protein [Zymobacter palmae]